MYLEFGALAHEMSIIQLTIIISSNPLLEKVKGMVAIFLLMILKKPHLFRNGALP